MYITIFAILSVWFSFSLLYYWKEETRSRKVERILGFVLKFPLMAAMGAIFIIAFPIALLWKFFRNAIRGVSLRTWEKAGIQYFLAFGNFRLVYDQKAKMPYNRFFLVRIVRPATKIKHSPAK